MKPGRRSGAKEPRRPSVPPTRALDSRSEQLRKFAALAKKGQEFVDDLRKHPHPSRRRDIDDTYIEIAKAAIAAKLPWTDFPFAILIRTASIARETSTLERQRGLLVELGLVSTLWALTLEHFDFDLSETNQGYKAGRQHYDPDLRHVVPKMYQNEEFGIDVYLLGRNGNLIALNATAGDRRSDGTTDLEFLAATMPLRREIVESLSDPESPLRRALLGSNDPGARDTVDIIDVASEYLMKMDDRARTPPEPPPGDAPTLF